MIKKEVVQSILAALLCITLVSCAQKQPTRIMEISCVTSDAKVKPKEKEHHFLFMTYKTPATSVEEEVVPLKSRRGLVACLKRQGVRFNQVGQQTDLIIPASLVYNGGSANFTKGPIANDRLKNINTLLRTYRAAQVHVTSYVSPQWGEFSAALGQRQATSLSRKVLQGVEKMPTILTDHQLIERKPFDPLLQEGYLRVSFRFIPQFKGAGLL